MFTLSTDGFQLYTRTGVYYNYRKDKSYVKRYEGSSLKAGKKGGNTTRDSISHVINIIEYVGTSAALYTSILKKIKNSVTED